MKTVAIVGVGLIGGSLGQALRQRGGFRVIGIARKAKTLRDARRLGAIDDGSQDLSAVRAANLVVVCTPVDLIVPTVEKLLPFVRAGSWITDAGSVKGPIVQAMKRLSKSSLAHFAGSHPLAGSHKTGVTAAQPTLYRKSTCVVVPVSRLSPAPVEALWKAAGARVIRLSAAEHDAAVALTSHLPHLLAHSLVHSVADRPNVALLKKLVAGSFRDGTRVASADPQQWVQIFRANKPAIQAALRLFRRELDRLDHSLAQPPLGKYLERSYRFRRPLFHGL